MLLFISVSVLFMRLLWFGSLLVALFVFGLTVGFGLGCFYCGILFGYEGDCLGCYRRAGFGCICGW